MSVPAPDVRKYSNDEPLALAAVYARKSTEQTGVTDDAKSVARQIANAREYAARKRWTVRDEHVYQDDGVSGVLFGTSRPGLARLLNALKPRPPFQILIMSEQSRLGREQIETGYVLKQIIDAGVRVFFYADDREAVLDDPVQKMMLSLTNFAAEMERDKARQRTHEAMLRKAKALHVTGGRVFGYDNARCRDRMASACTWYAWSMRSRPTSCAEYSRCTREVLVS